MQNRRQGLSPVVLAVVSGHWAGEGTGEEG